MSNSCCCTDNWPEVEAAAKAALTPEIVEYIQECKQMEHPKGQLIAILHKVQGHFGHLGGDQLDAVAQLLQVPASKVSGVATFYHFFRLTPRGKYIISVCLGTACYVKGAPKIADALNRELGIEFGETTKDGLFSLEATRCLGTCGLSPVIMVNDRVHGSLTADKIPPLLNEYAAKAQAEEK